MVNIAQIKPTGLLSPFVRCYALRKFNTGEMLMPKPLHALNECYMTFFLKGEFGYVINGDDDKKSYWSNNLYAVCTQPSGCAFFKGDFILFNVQFKANGIFAVFGIPQRLLLNTKFATEDILGNDERLITSQLAEAKNIDEMGRVMDHYLSQKLLMQKQSVYTGLLANITGSMLQAKGVGAVEFYANRANMSLRNFERRFIEEIGMPPKLFMRITRFYQALENKTYSPEKNWTTISLEAGYFDQTHFIKECREFSSKSPEELFRYTAPPVEKTLEP